MRTRQRPLRGIKEPRRGLSLRGASSDNKLSSMEAAVRRRPYIPKGARMAIGTLRRFVLDVNDLQIGEQFWSAVTGLTPRFSAWQGQFSALGDISTGSILLQLVPEAKTALKNRAHLDITVEDVGRAVEEVLALGGAVVKPPGLFPEADPLLEWAVMTDPFGNEFCLIRDIALIREPPRT